MSDRQSLYRFYDAEGVLLYVGITKSLPTRIKQHNDAKDWWTEVADVKVQHFASREEVVAAERQAIEQESPRYNVAHNRVQARTAKAPVAVRYLKPGQVVALGMTGGRCPVGYVEGNDGTWVTLTLKDWLTGSYCGKTINYRMADIVQWCTAMTQRDGVWLDECLMDFQTKWLAQ